MARRSREINIFNIAFLDVITGAMGAFVLMVLLLAPYYSGSSVQTRQNQQAAKSAVDRAQHAVRKAQESRNSAAAKDALQQAQHSLAEAQQQLDVLRRQLDQLTAQNRRLTKVDDQQQQQIAQLQQQLGQASKEALDRAEQNLARADKAAQSGDIEALKKLLAQARADLAQARQNLAALQQQLKETQAALRRETQRNAALNQQLKQSQQQAAKLEVQNQALRRQLDERRKQVTQMQQERDKAITERNQAANRAAAMKDMLAKSAPLPNEWGLATFRASPACNGTDFVVFQSATFPPKAPNSGFATEKEYSHYFWNADTAVPIAPGGVPAGRFSSKSPFERSWLLPLTPGTRELVGLKAVMQPPPNCIVSLAGYGWTYYWTNGNNSEWWMPTDMHVLMKDQRPVLFFVLPPVDLATFEKTKPQSVKPPPLTAKDIATWSKTFPNAVGPTLVSPARVTGRNTGLPDLRTFMGLGRTKQGKP